MDKDIPKHKIQLLIAKYERAKANGILNKYSEEETKKDFILPLFEALGWEVFDKNEVSAEESQSAGRVDYGFYLDGRVKFYVEAKPLKADIHSENYANQAVKYSWNKGVTWALLTDFESLLVFNAQDIESTLSSKLFFEIPYTQYIERFDQLWLLSKDALRSDLLDKEAEKVGKKLQKISVTSLLYKDLDKCRELLTHVLGKWNPRVDKDLLDEGVQKLLDRLIFLRVAEDRHIEPPLLLPMIRDWEVKGRRGSIYASMIKKFRELDEVYNSNLFSKHPFEHWEEYGGVTEKVINILYGKKGYYEYDFQAMPVDVLGNVYENYLGYKLSKSKKGITLSKDAKKRKEQGIYYTPNFIVDYITRNALKPVLDKCTSINDLKKIKVLDPACGSGSFLIKALEVIYNKYREFGNERGTLTKLDILLNNIYGVDLDPQAVEIARLNLLISALDQRMMLPGLDKNIKNGNSLISGTDEELEKYFGKNFRDKKPFNWEDEFSEVFDRSSPGFDVIISNPPWGANVDVESEYFAYKYPASTHAYKDTYKMFIDKGIQILRKSGLLGFVVPNTFLYQPRYEDIKQLVDQYRYTIINLGEKIFQNVELPCCTIVVVKEKSPDHQVVDLSKADRSQLLSYILHSNLLKQATISSVIWKDTGITLDTVLIIKDAGVKHQRINVGKTEKGKSDLRDRIYYVGEPKASSDHPLLIGSDINRYIIYNQPTFILRSNYKALLESNEIVYFDEELMSTKKKILWRQTADRIRAVLVDDKWFANTLQCAILKPEHQSILSLEYCLAILNSTYLKYLYQQKVLEAGKVFPQVKLKYLRPLPFVIGTKEQQKQLITLVQQMIDFNRKLNKTTEGSDTWRYLKSEIEKTDKKIDKEVYKLYDLTPGEIKIVEESVAI